MAKQVTHAVEFRDPFQPSFGPDRSIFVVACDDGSLYEFQKMSDSRIWTMRARGDTSTPRRQWTQRRAPLPTDVTDTLDDALGENRWKK